MSLGAFAGGMVKGYQTTQETINSTRRTALAAEDAELRKRASDREETRYKREQSEWEKKDALEKELADNVNAVFGKSATPDTTGTMMGPLDAKDARAGTMDNVATEYNIPGQPATGAGGIQGLNLSDPKNHGLLLKLESMNMASRMKYGMVKPEEVRQLQAWGQKLEQDGTAQALGRFMMGDTAALDEVAKRNGVKQYSTFFGKDEDGYPGMMFKIEREDGSVQTVPATLVAAGLGATGFVTTLDKMEDNATNRYKAEALGNYYGVQGQAALERNDILEAGQEARLADTRRRTDAYIGTQGALARKADRWTPSAGRSASGKEPAGPSYDSTAIRKAYKDLPPEIPQFGKKSALDDGKPKKDVTGMERAVDIGTYLLSIGQDPARAESTSRKLLRDANEAAKEQVGPNASQEEFLKVRNQFLDQAVQAAKKSNKPKPAAPARSSALPIISPSEQKARDTDRVGILRQEQEAEKAKLAKLEADPKADKDELSRTRKNIEALDRELGNTAGKVAALRTR